MIDDWWGLIEWFWDKINWWMMNDDLRIDDWQWEWRNQKKRNNQRVENKKREGTIVLDFFRFGYGCVRHAGFCWFGPWGTSCGVFGARCTWTQVVIRLLFWLDWWLMCAERFQLWSVFVVGVWVGPVVVRTEWIEKIVCFGSGLCQADSRLVDGIWGVATVLARDMFVTVRMRYRLNLVDCAFFSWLEFGTSTLLTDRNWMIEIGLWIWWKLGEGIEMMRCRSVFDRRWHPPLLQS